jgi:hypothetical protein
VIMPRTRLRLSTTTKWRSPMVRKRSYLRHGQTTRVKTMGVEGAHTTQKDSHVFLRANPWQTVKQDESA